jgi:isoquinoline 1-oxidoreductase alpha subunit
MRFDLQVNGRRRTVETLPGTPLLWVLRDALGLKGAKYGCGIGACGACTVHSDGRPVRSCTLPVEQVGSSTITTIEGLSPDGSHPIQRAWVEHDVAQCGYCHTGQIMAAAALLDRYPHPTADQMESAMDRVLCRCGTYTRIRTAIRDVAGPGEGAS